MLVSQKCMHVSLQVRIVGSDCSLTGHIRALESKLDDDAGRDLRIGRTTLVTCHLLQARSKYLMRTCV